MNEHLKLILEAIANDDIMLRGNAAEKALTSPEKLMEKAVDIIMFVAQGMGHAVAKRATKEQDYTFNDDAAEYVGVIDKFMKQLTEKLASGAPAPPPPDLNARQVKALLDTLAASL